MQIQPCFGSFFIYSLFSADESSSLVKNVEVEFEIKPRHPISRGNMPVDQPFLKHCSRRSSYFSNFRWCAQSTLASKGIVNSVMITFLWINWPNDEIWTPASWCYFRWKRGLLVYVSNSAPVRATIKQCWFVPISIFKAKFYYYLIWNLIWTPVIIWNLIKNHCVSPINFWSKLYSIYLSFRHFFLWLQNLLSASLYPNKLHKNHLLTLTVHLYFDIKSIYSLVWDFF